MIKSERDRKTWSFWVGETKRDTERLRLRDTESERKTFLYWERDREINKD